MKHLLLLLLALTPLVSMAQDTTCNEDTTLFFKGRKIVINEQNDKIKVKLYESTPQGDTINNAQIFEGVYLNGQSRERRTALDVLPFAKKRKKNYHNFEPHICGVYIGYANFGNGFLSFNPSNRASLDAPHAWEIGGTLLTDHVVLSPSSHWGLTAGLGWGYRTMRLDGNHAFREIDGVTQVSPGDKAEEPTEYFKSRLRYFFFRIPVSIEWQTRFNDKGPVFFSVGPEAEIRHGVKSKGKINGSKETFDKGLNVRPIGVNLLAQAGAGNVGVYMRYSTLELFEKDKGPELYPFSFGLCWYW